MTTSTQPANVNAYVAAFEGAARSMADLARSLTPEEWTLPTDCPGWTVGDHVAHVVALERQFIGDPLPPELDGYGPHVRGPAGEHMERGVAAYRNPDPAALANELDEVIDQRMSTLRARTYAPDEETIGVLGRPLPMGRFLPVRVFDVWAHEQDIRRAVGRPGHLTGPAAEVSLDRVASALPYVVGHELKPPAGTTVGFRVTGPVGLKLTVRVDDESQGSQELGLAADADVVLHTDFETFMRLACGRVDAADADVTIEGDQELGRRLLAELAITP